MTASTACAPVRARLSPYLDARLAVRAELVVRRHLERCTACRAELERSRRVGSVLAGLPYDAPVRLAERVRRAERRRARRVSVRRGAARASAALVVFTTAAFLGLAGLRAIRGPVTLGPATIDPATIARPASAQPATESGPAGLERVVDGPALAEWERVRSAPDAAVWLDSRDAEESGSPVAPAGSTAGYRAPR